MDGSRLSPGRPEGSLVIASQMAKPRARNGSKAVGGRVIGLALELDRTNEAAAGPGGEPALDECQEPRRIAHDIREQPVDWPDRARVEREGALVPVLDLGQTRDRGRERRFVDADDMRPHPLEGPAPAARAAPEIEASLARAGPASDQGQRLPKLEISAARRPAAVFDEIDFAVRKGARATRCHEHGVRIEQGP